MAKKGDTLIEVTLAVGIFSMIAIAIASVMSNGTSNAQTALETTLAREEIDTQAEALRFIQSSYIADQGSENKRFINLWNEITKNAIPLDPSKQEQNAFILQYAPESCADLYKNNPDDPQTIYSQKAFVINPKTLGSFKENEINEVFVSSVSNEGKYEFRQASIYPRLIYDTDDTTLSAAEGIYVIAVPEFGKKPAFYDFYIRTCWYGTNADRPSTISTVIRLYNPDIVEK